MDQCKTCSHWEKSEEYSTGHGLGLGRCKATPMLWDSTEWSDDGESRSTLPEFEKTTAFVQDGSDYSASLYTRPEHGCVMHNNQQTEWT